MSWVAPWVLAFSLLGLLRGYWAVERRIEPSEVRCQGIVVHERTWGRGQAGLVSTPLGRLVVISRVPISEGDRVELSGRVVPLEPPEGDGFDQEVYWRSQGAVGAFEGGISVLQGESGVLSRLLKMRLHLERRVLLELPPLCRGYVAAALFGLRDQELTEAHRRWGTSHVLAVSGFHVGLVLLGFSLIPLFRGPRSIWLSIPLWGYVALAGFSASAVRAAAMAQVGLLGVALGRGVRGMGLLASGAYGVLMVNPWLGFNIGFMLSVSSVAVLLGYGARLGGAGYPLISAAVWFATYPLVSRWFGFAPLVGLLSNLLAMPFFTVYLGLLIPASALALALGVDWPVLPLEWVAEAYGGFMDLLWRAFPRVIPYHPALEMVSLWVLALGILLGLGFRGRRLWVAVGLVVISSLAFLWMGGYPLNGV